ncbi:hypothetical protein HSB1_44690 [Halogranum salarium B-1]|uniref:Uncharacterized protein n=1 Tax=Halogranum salarium B-1 TaxID=1210908 RepID=J2ZVM4_9EURY|nr:hypothetical protein HSB1_44690 [Halogranum salarium B-1]
MSRHTDPRFVSKEYHELPKTPLAVFKLMNITDNLNRNNQFRKHF